MATVRTHLNRGLCGFCTGRIGLQELRAQSPLWHASCGARKKGRVSVTWWAEKCSCCPLGFKSQSVHRLPWHLVISWFFLVFPSKFWYRAASIRHCIGRDFSKYQLNAQFFYSSTIHMLHYSPQHVSSSTLLIIRRTNCITTASGIVTLCKQPYSMRVESGLMMSSVLLETWWGA